MPTVSPGRTLGGTIVDWLTDWLIGFASDRNHPLGLAALFLSAMVEYVFPPFPGDTITLLGAVLITSYGWSWWPIFAAVVAGSVLGSQIDYWIGLRLAARPRSERSAGRWATLDGVVARFRRRGPVYLVLNRFVPGIRALFFVAAGLSGMRQRDVLLYGGISVALWNALIIGLGAALGANLDSLERWVRRYSTAAWAILLGGVALYVVLRLVARARRRRRERQE
jgi:membrane protein DedA with SNARE-associated domain